MDDLQQRDLQDTARYLIGLRHPTSAGLRHPTTAAT